MSDDFKFLIDVVKCASLLINDKVACIKNKKTCAAVNFAWVVCGRLSATNIICDTLWDYIPGQFIVEKAVGIIYNNKKIHVASNNIEFLNILKDSFKFCEN